MVYLILLAFLLTLHAMEMTPKQLRRYFGVNSVEEAPEFEIVFPQLGDSESTSWHDSGTEAGGKAMGSSRLALRVTAFGEDLRMLVHRESSFMVDGLQVEYVGGTGGGLSADREAARTDCFYRGALVGEEEAMVSVSACSGIIAFIQRRSDTFYIEPIDEEDAHEMDFSNYDHLGAPHIMYKGHKKDDLQKYCDITGDETDWYYPFPVDQIHLVDFEGLSTNYIETMVVGDSALYDIRGLQTANYILALMNAVSNILSLSSLIGDKLQLVVVGLRVYTNNTGDLVTADHGHWTLFHFCKWQDENNPSGDDDADHYDIATLLTGRNIFGNHGNGTMGISLTGGACNREKQCSLVEFLGLDAIYVTAHEIGHSLGMHHDGHHGNLCPEEGFLMCPRLQDNEATLGWSDCSRDYLLQLLSTTGGCLGDTPGTNLLPQAE